MKMLTALLSAVASEAATEAVNTAPELFFEPANFIESLKYMGIGMLVIFVIIGVIILATVLINKIFSK